MIGSREGKTLSVNPWQTVSRHVTKKEKLKKWVKKKGERFQHKVRPSKHGGSNGAALPSKGSWKGRKSNNKMETELTFARGVMIDHGT